MRFLRAWTPQGYFSLGSAGMRPTMKMLAEGTLKIILSPFSTESPDTYLTALKQYHPHYRGSQKKSCAIAPTSLESYQR